MKDNHSDTVVASKSCKALFDNHFNDRYLDLSEADRKTLQRQAKLRRYVRYITPELVDEMVAIVTSPQRAERLRGYAQLFVETVNGRVFSSRREILESELTGSTRRFLGASEVGNVFEFMRQVSNGHFPVMTQEIKEFREEKEKGEKDDRDFHEKLTALIGKGPFAYCDYTEFYKRVCHPVERETVRRHVEIFFHGNVEQKVEEVIRRREIYPWTWHFIDVALKTWYDQLTTGRGPKAGDRNDLAHLFYMKELDIFVTDDGHLRRLFKLVFGTIKKLYDFDGFVVFLKQQAFNQP